MPSRSGRRAMAPSPIRAGRPRRRVMRISERILSTVWFGVGLGLATAYAFDGTRSTSDIAPAVGIDMMQRAGAGNGGVAAPAPPATFLPQSLPSNPAPGALGSSALGPSALGPSALGPSALGPSALGPSATVPSALTSFQAFQSGARALRAGDTKAGLSALEYAAANGQPIAAWKLGRMYAEGDGVKQSDLRAFEYFRGI